MRYRSPETSVTQPSNNTFPLLDVTRVTEGELRILYEDANSFLRGNVLTFGGLNTDLFYPQLKRLAQRQGQTLIRPELCPDEDEAIGLLIPHAWYFSQNPHALGVAMWYVDYQTNVQPTIAAEASIIGDYGLVSVIECYRRDDLTAFARQPGYIAFSVPYDLVQTARHITRHIEDLAQATSDDRYLDFIRSVISNTANRQTQQPEDIVKGLTSLDETARQRAVLEMMRNYWQDILVPRGIVLTDEDVVIVDQVPNRPETETLDYTRRPFLVFIGGSISASADESQETIRVKNISLARAKYPPTTQVIAPTYTDGSSPQFRQQAATEVTPDLLVLSLITLRELGEVEKYQTLRARYAKLCQSN